MLQGGSGRRLGENQLSRKADIQLFLSPIQA